MRNKFTLLIASMLVSVSSFAQWTKPAAPSMEAMEVGKECYLYNKGADGFLCGGNDYGTRASVSNTLGHKVIIESGTIEGSYYISNFVLSGWMANQWGYMFIENNIERLFVDNTKEGKTTNQFAFEAQSDGTYKIGLSSANSTYSPTDYPGAYLGVSPSLGETVVSYCDPENSYGYQMDECHVNWYFVSPANYESYVSGVARYNASEALKLVIDEAKATDGIDATALSNAEKAYANTSNTAEALTNAANELSIAIKNAKYANATAQNPIEVLSMLGIATDFTDGTCPGWTSTTGAVNKQASNGNNALNYDVTGNHYENWSADAFTIGKIYATATNLPKGVYHLQALAFANKLGDTYLYAGEDAKKVTSSKINIDEPMDVYAVVEDGKLEVGLDIRAKGANWVGLDNVYLYYLGDKEDAYEALVEGVAAAEPDYEAMLDAGDAYCQTSVYEEYQKAFESISSDKSSAAVAAFYKASEALESSVSAYASYYNKVMSAEEWLVSTTSESDETILLSDYISDDTEAVGLYNGRGGALYILTEGLLDNSQIAAETAYLEKILKDAMSDAMSDGDDCTQLLVNPNFTENGGWTAAQGITWPEGSDSFKVFQAWGRVCDVYQQLNTLQNGIYEMNLQAVYKPDSDADIRQTYAYINDFDTKIGIPEEDELLSSAEDASAKFAEGKYPVQVYGLVTDGTMKIGIANRLRTGENGVLWAGGVSLTFRAKNAEACGALLASLKPQATTVLESHIGSPEASELTSAVSDAEGVSGDDGYDALVALKKALDAANQSATLYADLKVALDNLREAINNNPNAEASVVAQAESLYSDATAGYEAKSYGNAQAEQVLSDVKAMTSTVKMSKPSQGQTEEDYTDLIVNNNFDPAKGDKNEKRIDGWQVEGALNGYKSYSCSFNKGTFNLSQTLEGLPKGKYKVTVQTYYRAGSYEEEGANINAGKDTHLMKFYANTSVDNYITSIMNLSEGSKGVTLPEGIGTKEINGITVPDGTSSSVKCYEAGLFLNELEFNVGEDGKVVIGLRLDETIGTNDYTVVGPWHLYYYGDESSSEEDYTDLIENNNFDPAKGNKNEKRIDGWQVEGALNGYKEYSCSFNKGTFNLSQDLEGLHKGKYKVTVNTYYRAGSFEEEAANINAGKDTHLMKFYANTSVDNYVTSIMNLSEGSKGVTLPEGINTSEINGITVPNGTSPSVKCYEAGLFLNELTFYVGDDGKATIGLRLDETIGTNDYTVVGPWHLYYYGEEKVTEEDYSELIVNNNFDPAKGDKNEKRIDGWQVEGALNGYKEYSCSFNKGTFNLSQNLEGLPEGNYKVTVNTYYRAGSFEEEAVNINAGKDTHLMKLYANTSVDNYVTSIMNLSEGSKGVTLPEGINTSEINGITVPNGTSPSVKCYEAGLFLNELEFSVGKDGKATIGLRLDQTIGSNDYTVVGPWHLYYYGSGSPIETAIEGVEVAPIMELVPVAYYSLSGVKLSAQQKGVNLVKMSNGQVVKMLVK